MASTLAEVPLIDGQRHVDTIPELVLGQECRNFPDHSFVQPSRSHESVQSLMKLLLLVDVLRS